ncbi:MAG: GNAT family N-acetyltransferase [Moraxellaceae bacterium]|nr:GNAT family N-acetyltransferase [Pseudobdellovibrionaceae bacterium]
MTKLNSSKFLIRKATSDDAPSVAFINAQSWQTTYREIIDQDFLKTITQEQQLPRANRLVESIDLSCIVAENNSTKEIVGFTCFGKSREPKVDADCELQAIYLLEAFQKLGIGTMLFEYGVKELKEKSKEKMTVSVFESNKGARFFYERQGGKQIENDHVDLAGTRHITSTYIWNLK